MDHSRYAHIPEVLFESITFLSQALPVRSIPTWLELLFGSMLTQAGFVTEAYLAINARRHWTSYYKWLQKGKWSWVSLGLQTARWVIQLFPAKHYYLAIDDTIVFRSSRQAPGSKIHHQHGSKCNRPEYVRGQCWVSLMMTISKKWRIAAVPILSRLARHTGNSNKLIAAKTLIRTVRSLFNGNATLLMDSWYMRKNLILPALEMGYQVIGQVRKDTALYLMPEAITGKRGRPRKYGEKVTFEKVAEQPITIQRICIYGKWQTLHYCNMNVMARFLNGRLVKAVWAQIENEDGSLSEPRLFLATDTRLSATRILLAYARRWAIEDAFNQLKNRWGWKETWQQSRQVLHRWTQIISCGYAIPQLMAFMDSIDTQQFGVLSPWRRKHPITAGRIRMGLCMILKHVNIRAFWNSKSRKFEPPKDDDPEFLNKIAA